MGMEGLVVTEDLALMVGMVEQQVGSVMVGMEGMEGMESKGSWAGMEVMVVKEVFLPGTEALAELGGRGGTPLQVVALVRGVVVERVAM